MKVRNIAISLAALLLCTVSHAQVNVGVKGGISGSWINGVVLLPGARIVPHPALYGGIYANADIADGFFCQAELIYAGKGHSEYTNLGSVSNKYSLSLGYLQIPAMFGMELFDGKYHLMVGPELGILLHADAIDKTGSPDLSKDIVIKENYRSNCNALNLGICLQSTYFVTDNLGIDVKFDWGASRTFKKEAYDKLGIKGNAHNLSVQLGVCYNIEL